MTEVLPPPVPGPPVPEPVVLMRVRRVRSYREVVRAHLPMALLGVAVFLVAWFLPVDRIPFTFCGFRRLTGWPCPGCGLTRAFCALGRGDFDAVLHTCPLAFLAYAGAAAFFAWHAAALLFGVRLELGAWTRQRWVWWAGGLVLGLLLAANWIYRLAHGLA